MSGDSLSQEEIDALLAGGGDAAPAEESPADADASAEVAAEAAAEPDEADAADEPATDAPVDVAPEDDAPEADAGDADAASDEAAAPAMAGGDNRKVAPERFPESLTADERDALGEIGNISMASAATTLSTLLGHQAVITTPTVAVTTEDDVKALYDRPAALVRIHYTEGLSGVNVFVISTRDASVVADLMMGGSGTPSDEIDEIHASAVGEAMNQMMGAAATSMASMFGMRVDISSPEVQVLDMATPDAEIGLNGTDEPTVCVSFDLEVGEFLNTTLMQLMPLSFAKELVSALLASQEASGSAPAASDDQPAPAEPPPAAAPETEPQLAAAAAAATTAPPPPAAAPTAGAVQERPGAVAQPVTFPSLDGGAAPGVPGDIGLLMDIPLQVSVELGRTQLRIRNVLELVPGSIIELERLAGEPVDVLVNGRQLARGEVVVIDEEFGIRITEIASQASRLQGIADG
ncbi:MAG: flagellar motor switch phosphatase FliY [Actinobacteria bacterium]|nr:flagellar motor switch phosphatase FliY [Actinomycetota bacterium]